MSSTPFSAVRIGEIQSTTDVKDWFKIEREFSIVDLATRNKQPSDIDEDSRW